MATPPNAPQQLPSIHDVGPMKTAGIGNGQQHLAVRAQGRQNLQRRQWHAGHAEHHHAPRHRADRRHALRQSRYHPLVHTGPNAVQIRRRQGGQQGTPQHGLPRLLGRHRLSGPSKAQQHILPLGPSIQPIGPVHLILVKQVGQAGGQLVQAVGLIPLQETGHRLKARLMHPQGQELHQTPSQGRFVGGALAGHLIAAQHLPVRAPHEARRQLNPYGSTHAAITRQGHLQPLSHASALHQDDLFLQRRQRALPEPRQQSLGQCLGTVAVQGEQASLDIRVHGECVG